jgi:NADH-quinone oxidoreductase subunit J
MAVALITAILHSGFANRPADGNDAYPVLRLGEAFLGDYLVPFELISVLLLAVMIGAAYLAKARKRTREGRP